MCANAKRSILTGLCVRLEAEHNLWRSVPPRGHILRHVPGIFLWVYAEASRQTKVANLQLAVRIHEEVAGLQITVKDIGRVFSDYKVIVAGFMYFGLIVPAYG